MMIVQCGRGRGGGPRYVPTVIVTNQSELDTELSKSAATLEGAVIGVVYNATPYVIPPTGTASLRNKDFGAGRLVFCQSGGTMPIFSTIDTDDTVGVTFYSLEVHNTAGANLFMFSDNTWEIWVDRCKVHGTYRDPNGDYTAAGSYTNPRAFNSSLASGKYLKNISITDCEIYDAIRGFAFSVAGTFTATGNDFHDLYEDPMSFGYNASAGAPRVVCNWNAFRRPIGKGTDEDDPHVDFIQFLDPGANQFNVEVIGNIGCIGEARGDFQGIFCNFSTAGAYLTGAIKGNVIANNTAHGISIDRAHSLVVIGNTIVASDPDVTTNTNKILVGYDGTSGTHVIKNNVTHQVAITGASTESNNHELTRTAAAYGAVFDGPTFTSAAVDDTAAALAAYVMKVGGALDQSVNIGAVGSGYVDFTARTINEAME